MAIRVNIVQNTSRRIPRDVYHGLPNERYTLSNEIALPRSIITSHYPIHIKRDCHYRVTLSVESRFSISRQITIVSVDTSCHVNCTSKLRAFYPTFPITRMDRTLKLHALYSTLILHLYWDFLCISSSRSRSQESFGDNAVANCSTRKPLNRLTLSRTIVAQSEKLVGCESASGIADKAKIIILGQVKDSASRKSH